jgi:hypothetical protein
MEIVLSHAVIAFQMTDDSFDTGPTPKAAAQAPLLVWGITFFRFRRGGLF